jgi:hypothetical protein
VWGLTCFSSHLLDFMYPGLFIHNQIDGKCILSIIEDVGSILMTDAQMNHQLFSLLIDLDIPLIGIIDLGI